MSEPFHIIANSRQIPKVKEITANKLYKDILYGYLQIIATEVTPGSHVYAIAPKKIKYKTIGDRLGIHRDTVKRCINELIVLGLLEAPTEERETYLLKELPREQAFLIPFETLTFLVNVFKERVITIYVYLFNRFFANGQKPFQFTITSLKEICGISTNTRSNNVIITDALDALELLGLIEVVRMPVNAEGHFETHYILKSISQTVPKRENGQIKWNF